MEKKIKKIQREEIKKRSTATQVIYGLIAYFSTIAPSMSLGYSAVALPGLTIETNPYCLNKTESSWFVSIATIATPIGCFISGPISDRFGRRASLIVVNVATFVGWITLSLAPTLPEHLYPILLIGRILTGFSTGLASMPASVYVAEISSPKLRGMFTTASAIFFSLGILVVYILGFLMQDDWSKIAMITSALPVLSMTMTVFFLPESPQWLIAKNREFEAKKNMVQIYGFKEANRNVDEEIQTLITNREKNKLKSKKTTAASSALSPIVKKIKHFMNPTCYKPFTIILAYFFFLQFSGTFVIIFYAIDIVKEAGISTDPYIVIVMIASTRLLGAFVVSVISRKLGRRPPSIISGIGMTICMMSLFTYLYLIKVGKIDDEGKLNVSWLPVTLLVLYFFTSTLGFLTVPFAMAAEVFPTKIRGLATGLVTCLAYGFNFIILKSYPLMLKTMGNYGVFCFYGTISFIGTVFIIFLLPETKGKTLQEIEEYFGKKRNTKKDKLLEC